MAFRIAWSGGFLLPYPITSAGEVWLCDREQFGERLFSALAIVLRPPSRPDHREQAGRAAVRR